MTTKVIQAPKDAVGTDAGISKKSQELLASTPVWKALRTFAIPAVIGMTIQGSYTFVDKLIVANFVGPEANSGLLIAEQLVSMILAIGLLIGVGAGAYYGICLGKKDQDKVRSVISTGLITGLVFGIIAAIVIILSFEPLMVMMGSGALQIKYAGDYIKIIALGFPLYVLGTILLNFLRTEGKNKVAALAIITSAILNIVIDLILIVGFGMGIEGAAIATLVGGYLTVVIFAIIFAIRSNETNLKFNWFKFVNYKKVILGTIIIIGLPTFLRSIASVVSQMYASGSLASLDTVGFDWTWLEGDVNKWQAVLAGAFPTFMFLILPLMGVIQAQTPILSYNIGANNAARVRETFIKSTIIQVIFTILVGVIFWFFGGWFLEMFGVPGEFNIYTRYIVVGIISMVFIFQVSSYYQVTKKTFRSIMVGMSRNLFFLVPLLAILARDGDPSKAFMAYLYADIITFVLCGLYFWRIIHKLKKGII